MTTRRALPLVLLPLLAGPATAAAKAPKPSLRVDGVAVNRFFIAKGQDVKADDGSNGCYSIAGPDGAPPSLVAAVFVTGRRVPKAAKLTYTFHTPWDDVAGGEARTYTGTWGKGLAKTGGTQAFGGPSGRATRFTYSMLPAGVPTSYHVDGTYRMVATVKTGGRTLTARATMTVDCF